MTMTVVRGVLTWMDRSFSDIADGIDAALDSLGVLLVGVLVLATCCIPIALVVLAFMAVLR